MWLSCNPWTLTWRTSVWKKHVLTTQEILNSGFSGFRLKKPVKPEFPSSNEVHPLFHQKMRAMSLSRHLNGLQHVSPSFFFFDVPPNSGALRVWGALGQILSGTCKRRSFFLGHCVPPESNAPIICLHSAQSNSAELRRSSGAAQALLRRSSGGAPAWRACRLSGRRRDGFAGAPHPGYFWSECFIPGSQICFF